MPPRKKLRFRPPSRNPELQPHNRVLKDFKSRLCRMSKLLICPLCKESVTYTRFEKHCQAHHDLNPRLQCVFCLGEYSWPSMQKYLHMDHVISCFERFKNLQSQPSMGSPSTTSTPPPTLLNLRHIDRKPFDHDASQLPDRAQDIPCPAPLKQYALTFQDDALNLAVSCVRLYLRSSTFEWFHVSVRTPVYARFLEVVEAHSARVQILPFACWCDGGNPKRARFRQHRHLIVACTERDYFVNKVWRQILMLKRDKPYPRYRGKHLTRITNAMHLVRTIGYVSRRLSQCTFTGKKGPRRNNHFYLSQTLPVDYQLPLVLLWDDGLLALVRSLCKNMNRRELVQSPHLRQRLWQWCMKIKHVPGLPMGMVLPVSKVMEPSCDPTLFELHLMDGEKLYFDQNVANLELDEEAWLQRQAERGNLFFHVVGEKLWIPRPYQQGYITEFKPLVDENLEMKLKVSRLEGDQMVSRQEAIET